MDQKIIALLFSLFAMNFADLKDDMDALEKVLASENQKMQNQSRSEAENAVDVESSLLSELRREVEEPDETINFKEFKRRFNNILKRKGQDIFQGSRGTREGEVLGENTLDGITKPKLRDSDRKVTRTIISNKISQEDEEILANAVSDDVSAAIKKSSTTNDAEDEESTWKRAFEEVADLMIKRNAVGCKDKRPDCASLKTACDTHSTQMEDLCMKTCGRCACVDQITRCEYLKKLDKCDTDVRMQNLCPKTCGFCLLPSPPKCSKSMFGCCWDKETTKDDEKGTNCLPCSDAYRYVCKTFAMDCKKINDAGTFMRHYCPEACQLCSNTCFDNPKSAFYCPFWKKDLKWCELEKENMRHFCPATCGYC